MDEPLLVPACVDASFVAAVLLTEPSGPRAGALWEEWVSSDRRLLSAVPFAGEVISAVRRARVRGRLSADRANQAFRTFVDDLLPDVEVVPGTVGTWERAWEWSEELGRANVYDSIYLALAEEMGAEFWTTDENLYRALEADGRPAPAWVHLVTPEPTV